MVELNRRVGRTVSPETKSYALVKLMVSAAAASYGCPSRLLVLYVAMTVSAFGVTLRF